MIKRILFALVGLCIATAAHAQAVIYYKQAPGAGFNPVPVSVATPLPVTGTFSSTISGGFTDAAIGTPIAVTTGGVTGTLPAGAAVVATNVGTTNGAYCHLGGTATTSDQYLSPNGGWFAYQVGAATQLTCITSTSTTTVNMVGGSGLPTGTGGGGGGSGGAVTIASGGVASGAYASGSIASGAVASGAYASGAFASGAAASGSWADGAIVTLGTKADTACTSAPCSTNGWLAGLPADLALPPNLLVNGTATAWTGLTPGTAQTGTIIAANSDLTSVGGVAIGAMANYGTSPGAVKVQGVNASITAIAAGATIIGKFGIDQTTPGTTNGISIVGVNGATALGGTGAVGAGAQRVAVGTDPATVAGTAPVKTSVPIIDGANTYNTIAASQSAQALTGGSGGATGDYLSHCTVIPTTVSPGVVTILDNSTTIYGFPGGSSSLSNLVPFSIPIGALSTSGAWKITTGAGLSVVCVGKFT